MGALAGDPMASFDAQVKDGELADYYSSNALILSTDEAYKTVYTVKGAVVDELNDCFN